MVVLVNLVNAGTRKSDKIPRRSLPGESAARERFEIGILAGKIEMKFATGVDQLHG